MFENAKETVAPGDKLQVSVKGRNEEGYYELSRLRVEQPKDWAALEKAFEEKSVIVGTVTAVVKGGLSVDVGVRAFMPGSRSGARDAAEMENLVGQEIRCRIIKLDATEEDVVVDRRAIAEEEDRSTRNAATRRSAKAISSPARYAASRTTERSSTSAESTVCCISVTLPGAESKNQPMS